MILQGSAVTLRFHMGGTLVMELEEVAAVINSQACVRISTCLNAHFQLYAQDLFCFTCVIASVLFSINLQPQTSVFWV